MNGCKGEQAAECCSSINIISCNHSLFLLICPLNLNNLFQYISLSLFGSLFFLLYFLYCIFLFLMSFAFPSPLILRSQIKLMLTIECVLLIVSHLHPITSSIFLDDNNGVLLFNLNRIIFLSLMYVFGVFLWCGCTAGFCSGELRNGPALCPVWHL